MRALRKVSTPRRLGAAALVVAAISVMLGISGAANSRPLATGYPGVSIIAQNGFGDRNNSYAWSMAWFKGKLYVGTGRDELCIENETTNFYYPNSGSYVTRPSEDVTCTANPYKLPLQAEIWQYTPVNGDTKVTTTTKKTADGTTTTTIETPAGGTWKHVYKSPLIKNPLAKGMKVAQYLAFRGMQTMRNSQGQQALFAASVTPDEYLPPLQRSHPPEILRSFDGIHWTVVHLPAVVVHYPEGNLYSMGFRSFAVWKGHMFITSTPDITGDGGLMEVTNPWGSHSGLRQVSGPGYDIFEINVFDGGLYIGTGSKEVGYGVYRTFKYNPNGLLNFTQVVGDGGGRGRSITSVVSMHVYKNRLYVGSSGWYNKGTIPASVLIRIAPDGSWQLVVGNPVNLATGQTMYPVSGLYDGFFSPFAAHFWRMAIQGGGLYLGTNDWAYEVQEDKDFAYLQETAIASVLGFNIWATCDGDDWFNITRDGFTDDEYDFGGRNIVNGGPNDEDLFIGTANQAQGTSIFQDQAESCGSLVNSSRQAVERPAELMTDSLKDGTLLSWEPTPHAVSYEVLQAPFQNITLALKAPQTFPDGWNTDDAVPLVTQLGAPGSVTSTLSAPGQFTEVGTTENPDFVTHSTGHYVYEVVAKTASGARSAPSNVEITPFGGAPATFSELQDALVPDSASSSTVQDFRSERASAAVSPLGRLLAEAERASADGHYAIARREVAQVVAHAGENDNLATVAARVERRLQYARIAGAP